MRRGGSLTVTRRIEHPEVFDKILLTYTKQVMHQTVEYFGCDSGETHKTVPSRHGSEEILMLHTDKGWRAVDSPYDPRREAAEAVKSVHHGEYPVVMIGCGGGYLLESVLRKGCRSILIITSSMICAEKNRTVAADSIEFRNRSVQIIKTDRLDDNLCRTIGRFCFSQKSLVVVRHQREFRVFPSLYSEIDIFIKNIMQPVRNDASGIHSVLFPMEGKLLEPDIANAMRSTGLTVHASPSSSGKAVDIDNFWNIMIKKQPDAVFSINNRGSDRFGAIAAACRVLDIPWITWFFDEPAFTVGREERAGIESRHALCWDTAGCESCQRLGFRNVGLLPLATDPRIFHPGPGNDSLRGRIVYVGSPSFGNEKTYFSGLLGNANAHAVARELESYVTGNRRVPERKMILQALCDLSIAENVFSPVQLERLPAFVLYTANLEYRRRALTALSELRPIVYGDGWRGLLPENVETRRTIDYYRDLPDIYRSDAVHISLTHLQMQDYPNQRVFDIGASRRIVIGERLGGWVNLFGNSYNELLFDSFSELFERAAALAGNADKRASLGEMLFHDVLKKHTIRHRVATILAVMAGHYRSRPETPARISA